MLIQAVSKPFFNPCGMAKDQEPPCVAETHNEYGNPHNGPAQLKKCARICSICCQEGNGLFDDQGNKELKEIHHHQADQPQYDWPSVLNEVLFERQEITECICKWYGRPFHGLNLMVS